VLFGAGSARIGAAAEYMPKLERMRRGHLRAAIFSPDEVTIILLWFVDPPAAAN
jgi:hypothetical protein